ncbi:MAG: tRNA (adenosine(37)-N6)-threonylcarbamoyltransferase complex transferase subunit TsaD [Parcubacteria group bacterium]|nr:tRNA (adenosine(37)-N6)-threonylcarbamoyltransferase complex transferase subunit TsaD [Parcubacteria group bacterium]
MTPAKKRVILGIETSCDETAISIIEACGTLEQGAEIRVLSNVIISQIDIHKPYGGVFPMLAKREHARNLVPILTQALQTADLLAPRIRNKELGMRNDELSKLLEREPELLSALLEFLPTITIPKIDAIAVTYGPGLEPALWVGINFAKALSLAWNKPLIPVNHMEGHIFSAFLSRKEFSIFNFQFPNTPTLALLISGGHTELVLSKKPFQYKVVGETRDDAVGEAFDKAARVLGLPYPGGPEISKRAEKFRNQRRTSDQLPVTSYHLPRPMIHSDDFDFSFSGIKTAVLYMVKKIPELSEGIREEICYEFEEAVTETLLSKTLRATEKYRPKTVIMGGGVTANIHIQKAFKETFTKEFPDTEVLIPEGELSTDNALMIAAAGYARALHAPEKILEPGGRKIKSLRANGNLRL